MANDVTPDIERRLSRYRSEGLTQVQGWFAPESADVMATLLAHQVRAGIRGGVAEIGVHHGKSFLLLANGVRPGERAVALDVFGLQDKNIDNSGQGDRTIFEANIAAFAADIPIEIVEASSLDVTPEDARDVFGDTRMFSVDGGHTADITAHDLMLAEASLVEDGVVVLDDVLNAHWLGVASGLFRFLDGTTALVPFAYSENKLYLARSAAATAYAAVLLRAHSSLLGKPGVEFHSGAIDVYGQGSPQRRAAAAAGQQRIRDLETQNAALSSKVEKLTGNVQKLTDKVKKVSSDADRAKRRVAAIESSQSWRLTKPLRAVSGRVRHRSR